MNEVRDLQLRRTHKYVGEYQHLDAWQRVGTAEVIGYQTVDLNEILAERGEEYDLCEPHRTTIYVLARIDENINIDERTLKRALHDTFTSEGCAHEYDCCGCRSYRVSEAENVTGFLWKLTVNSSRNF